jgi:hypothetical protein
MTTTQKQRVWWIGGLSLAAFYFLPSSITHSSRAPSAAPPRVANAGKSKPTTPTVPPAGASGANGLAPAVADPSIAFAGLLGTWQGGGPLPGHGMCSLKFELRKKTDGPGQFSGYPLLICMPLIPGSITHSGGNPQDALLAQYSPLSAVLTGTPVNGSLQFTVDKVIGKGASGCALSSFTLTPFGADQLAAEWQEGTCQGGQILLKRAGR